MDSYLFSNISNPVKHQASENSERFGDFNEPRKAETFIDSHFWQVPDDPFQEWQWQKNFFLTFLIGQLTFFVPTFLFVRRSIDLVKLTDCLRASTLSLIDKNPANTEFIPPPQYKIPTKYQTFNFFVIE